MEAARQIVRVLGGPQVVGSRVRTLDQLADRLRTGLPYASLEAVQSSLGVTRELLAETLQLPTRTLARRRKERALHPDESDRLYRVARVYAHAVSAFGSEEKAAAWMTRPNRSLSGGEPLSRLDTDIGVQQVDELLGRIEHGIFG